MYVAERSEPDQNKLTGDGELLGGKALCRWACRVLALDFLLGNSE